jgi:hypothetical protein
MPWRSPRATTPSSPLFTHRFYQAPACRLRLDRCLCTDAFTSFMPSALLAVHYGAGTEEKIGNCADTGPPVADQTHSPASAELLVSRRNPNPRGVFVIWPAAEPILQRRLTAILKRGRIAVILLLMTGFTKLYMSHVRRKQLRSTYPSSRSGSWRAT